MEIKLNKLGCCIFALGLVCIVRQTCMDVKKLSKEMGHIKSRMDSAEFTMDDLYEKFHAFNAKKEAE